MGGALWNLLGTYSHLMSDHHSCLFSFWCSQIFFQRPSPPELSKSSSQPTAWYNHRLPRVFPDAIVSIVCSPLTTVVVTAALTTLQAHCQASPDPTSLSLPRSSTGNSPAPSGECSFKGFASTQNNPRAEAVVPTAQMRTLPLKEDNRPRVTLIVQ